MAGPFKTNVGDKKQREVDAAVKRVRKLVIKQAMERAHKYPTDYDRCANGRGK